MGSGECPRCPAAAVPGPAALTHGRCYLWLQAWVVGTAHAPSSPLPLDTRAFVLLDGVACQEQGLGEDNAGVRVAFPSGGRVGGRRQGSDVLWVTCSYGLRWEGLGCQNALPTLRLIFLEDGEEYSLLYFEDRVMQLVPQSTALPHPYMSGCPAHIPSDVIYQWLWAPLLAAQT